VISASADEVSMGEPAQVTVWADGDVNERAIGYCSRTAE
jgi:hypothetical protein